MSAPTANVAIDYHLAAFSLGRDKILGRQAACSGFLQGFFRHANVDELYCYAASNKHFQLFKSQLAAHGGRTHRATWIPHEQFEELKAPGCLYRPDPIIGPSAWQRRFGDQRGYSICGVTHTICSAQIMENFGALLTAPVQPWDAIICTSKAVLQAVEKLLAGWCGYLKERLHAQPIMPALLPVIPLGVDCDAFRDSPARQSARNELRRRIGIGPDDIAVLYVGRLSYHAKAHPLPMFQALEAASQRTGKPIWSLNVGWFANEAIARNFSTAARAWAPSARTVFLDGLKAENVAIAWAAADIFCSLADNIQETLGLAPIEAMAAGLPQVVSDWNGYRDTVRHGIDGFKIPTIMPPAGSGEQLARRYFQGIDDYDRYIGFTSQLTAVDVTSAADAFVRLIENADLRASMGQAARRRAQEAYDWRVIVRQYQELWAELAERRRSAAEIAPRSKHDAAHPLHDDPFSTFCGYPTELLGLESCLVASQDGDVLLDDLLTNPTTSFAAPFLLGADNCRQIVSYVRDRGKATPEDIGSQLALDEKHRLIRTISWLLKVNVLRLDQPDERKTRHIKVVSTPDCV